MASDVTWKVGPHGPLEQLSPRVWRVLADIQGMALKRVMTVAKRGDGAVVVHSAVALGEPEMAKLEGIGEIGTVLVPNAYHRIDAPRFVARYPGVKVLCPPGAKARVAAAVRVDGTYDDFPADPNVSLVMVRGTKEREGAMIVEDDDGTTLVLNDVLFDMPHAPGFTGFLFRFVTASSGGPRVTRLARIGLISDKRAFAEHLREFASLPRLRRVVVSHHRVIDERPADVLREVAATLG